MLLATALALATVVAARADYQSAVLADGPLAYYPLNLNIDTGNTTTDLSGNGNDGALMNLSAFGNNVAGPSAFITNAASFDGSSSYVDLTTGSNPGLLNFAGPITLEAWVQPADPAWFGNIVAKGYDSSTYQEITLRVNGPYGANYYGTSGTTGVSGGQQTTNWTHVVLSSDGTNCSLYVNSALVQRNADTTGSVLFDDGWAIGTGTSAGNGRYFKGNISQVALYNHGLSASQVINHCYQGFAGTNASQARPVILSQPQAQSTYAGGAVTFSVTVLSALPTTNLWFKNNAPLLGQTNTTLKLLNAGAGDVTSYHLVVGNSNGTTTSANAAFTLLSSGTSLLWSADNNNGSWDTGTAANWINQGNSQTVVFHASDRVTFDDTVGAPNYVSVDSAVAPSLITVNASANQYSFNGSGQITGAGSLIKQGSSTLVLNVAGGFTGSAMIQGGTVQTPVGSSLGSVSAITITNDATLDFNGNGLSGAKPITVSGNGIGGMGALYNSGNGSGGGDIFGSVINVTLAGDTTFGGTQRWDLGSGSSITGPHKLTLLRGVSGGYGEWDTVSIGADVPSIELINGNMGFKNMGSTFANPGTLFIVGTNCEVSFWSGGFNGSMHVRSTGRVNLWTGPEAFSGSNLILEEDARWYAWGGGDGDQVYSMNVTLNGVAHLLIGDHHRKYPGLISGPGGLLIEAWNHQMILSSDNTYTGPTIIGGGPQIALVGNGAISHSSLIFFGGGDSSTVHVDASGRADQTFTLANGQTLSGIGAVSGKMVVAAGATIAPAGTNTTIGVTAGSNPTGTLAASGDVTLNGTTILKLNGSGTNDTIQSAGQLSYGGTLSLVNISANPLVAGDTFTVFNAAAYAGTFASITPSSPGPGLIWDTTQLKVGKLSVSVPRPVINQTHVAGGSLIFSGVNGQAGGTYYILGSTNASATLTGWTPIATNVFDGNGAFSFTNAVNPALRQQFFLLNVP